MVSKKIHNITKQIQIQIFKFIINKVKFKIQRSKTRKGKKLWKKISCWKKRQDKRHQQNTFQFIALLLHLVDHNVQKRPNKQTNN